MTDDDGEDWRRFVWALLVTGAVLISGLVLGAMTSAHSTAVRRWILGV